MSSSYGAVFFRPPDRSTSSPKVLPEESKSQPTEPLGKVIQTEPGQAHESTLERPRKSDTDLSVNEQLLQSYNGTLEQIKTLLAKGAEVNARDKYGQAALMEAARRKNLEMVKFLIDKGADVNAQDNGGETVLMKAVSVERGYLEIIKFLIDKGADVNAGDKSGKTVLMTAAKGGPENLEIVKLLIDKGARVNARDKSGKTALISAAEKGESKIAKFLIVSGADVNAKDQNNRAALWEAAEGGHLEIVKSLVEKQADLNAKDVRGRTALMTAALRKHVDIVRLLVDKGADVNAKDNSGQTVLSLASGKNHPEIVRYLKAHGAKLSEVLTCSEPGDDDFPEQGVVTFLNDHAVYHFQDGETETADALEVWNKSPKEMCFFITTVTDNYHTCSLGGKATAVRENEYSYTENKCHVIFIFTKGEVKVKVMGSEGRNFCVPDDLDEDNGCGMNTSIDSATYKKTKKVTKRGY